MDVLLSDMRELENLQDVLGEAMKRAALLEQIVALCQSAQEKEDVIQINEGVILFAQLRKSAEETEACHQKLRMARRERELLETELVAVKEKAETARAAFEEARRQENENPENQALQYFYGQEKQAKSEYEAMLKKQNKLQKAEKNLEDVSKQLFSLHLAVPQSFMPAQLRKLPAEEQLQGLRELEQAFRSLKPQLKDLLVQVNMDIKECGREREFCEEEIRALRAGKWVYPDGNKAEFVRDAVNRELAACGYETDARILSELLYMKDESWQDATESCLGARRFDILVAPQHYFAAKKAFIALAGAVGSISLVDTPSLQKDSRGWDAPRSDELAYQVGSENLLARTYTAYLLHGYRCCDEAESLEQYPRSVTRDLLRHQGYRLDRMRKPDRFIGQQAKKERLRELEARQTGLLKRQTLLGRQSSQLDDTQDAYTDLFAGNAFTDLREGWDSPEICLQLGEKLQSFRKEIAAYENNPLLQGIFDRRKRCEQDRDAIESKHDGLLKQLGEWERDIKGAEWERAGAEQETLRIREEYGAFREVHPLFEKEVQSKYAELSKARAAWEIIKYQSDHRTQFQKALESFLAEKVIPAQNIYNNTYTCDYPLGLKGAETFRSLYDTLYNVDLEKYSEDINQAQIRCKERFRKDILFRMKDDIAQAKRQIRELDTVMRTLPYGEETYHFVLESSKDSELSSFCAIIQDESNRQISDASELEIYAALQDTAYETQIEEFMRRIMADVETASDARLAGEKDTNPYRSRYVDYRTYLNYDIRIENSVTGGSVLLSQVSGDSSGGENQAPYYVAMCASLLQIYKHSENSIHLILLDEAFNRMTSDRIWPMMRMFQEMHMQVVLVSTVEKCTAIQPSCDITYSIVKSGARNAIRPFIKEPV